MLDEKEKIKRFADQMLMELEHNKHKGSVLDWKDFNHMIMELEYHKSKMFLAIRVKNYLVLKEYIADVANILLAIGNLNQLYDEQTIDSGLAYELNKDADIIKSVSILNQAQNQKLI